jgi:hypothetical protein
VEFRTGHPMSRGEGMLDVCLFFLADRDLQDVIEKEGKRAWEAAYADYLT